MRRILFGLTLVLGATFVSHLPAHAQDVLIRAGHLFDSESGTLLPKRDVLVRDGIVVEIAEHLSAGPNTRMIDLSRYTLAPGLVDAHTHLLAEHPGTETSGEQGVRELVREGDALRALRGAARARSYLEAGFTAVRDLGNAGRYADVSLRRAIDEGVLPGPRLFVSGQGLAPPGAQMDGIIDQHQPLISGEYRIIRGVDDARTAVREAGAQGVNIIKVFSDSSPNPAFLSVAEMRAIVEEAHLMGLTVAAHATSDASINRALDAGVDTIEHGRGASRATLDRLRRARTMLVLTEWSRSMVDASISRVPAKLRPSAERVEAIVGTSRGRVNGAKDAGVRVAFGSDLYVDLGLPRGAGARQALYAYVEGGMTPAEALRSATYLAGATAAPGKVGVIRVGAFGDFVAVEGDPTRDIRVFEGIGCVLKGGEPVAGLAPACSQANNVQRRQ